LLDFRIVEFAMNLSENLKVRNGESKYLLKKLLYSRIPATYFQRPKKGFSIPLKDWLKGELRYLLDDNLNSKALETTGLFNEVEVNRLKKEFLQGKDYLYNRIWAICLLQRWMLKHKVYAQ
jgi:asparagine synthase (glutamine-hydrolysing)